MARGPGRQQPDTNALESTTAMPSVSSAAMQNVGRQAAKVVDTVVDDRDAASSASKKTSKKAAVEPRRVAPSADAAEQAGLAKAMGPDGPVAQAMTQAAQEAVGSSAQATRQAFEAGVTMVESAQEAMEAARLDAAQAAEGAVQDSEASIRNAGSDVQAASAAASEALAEAAAASHGAAATLADLNAKIAEALRSNIEANVSFLTSLFDARSLAQAADLNRLHLQRQMSAFASQSHDLTALARKLALDAMGALAGSDPGRRI